MNDSADTLDPNSDAEFDEVWRDEIEARLAAVRDGAVTLANWNEAAARIRQALEQRRNET
jgi:hypothetical protein